MKTTIVIIISAFLAAFTINAQNDEFTVRVDGLGCPFCAYGIEKKFSEVDGIKNIEVNLEQGILTYTVPTELKMDFNMVDKLVEGAGYTTIFVEVKRADGTQERFENKQLEPVEEVGVIEAVIKVYGNCSMCKTRIEKAAMALPGVNLANWDENDQLLKVIYDSSKSKLDDIHKAVAGVGHDTEQVRARNRVYNNLHECCKYDRPAGQ